MKNAFVFEYEFSLILTLAVFFSHFVFAVNMVNKQKLLIPKAVLLGVANRVVARELLKLKV